MPSQDEVGNFQAIIGRLAALAGDTAANIMREIDEADQAEAYAAAVDPHLSASSLITAEWYDSLSDKPFAVTPAPPADLETLRYKAGWAATEPDPAAALQGATDRLVYDASRNTVVLNAEREEVRYARHAQEDACAFCRLLATRGLIYHSRESAAASHDLCQCVVVPERDGDFYVAPDYVHDWKQQYKDAVKEIGSAKDADAIINHMRRARHAEDPERDNLAQRDNYNQNKDRINELARKRYANKKNVPL
jgi:hypothetical protein